MCQMDGQRIAAVQAERGLDLLHGRTSPCPGSALRLALPRCRRPPSPVLEAASAGLSVRLLLLPLELAPLETPAVPVPSLHAPPAVPPAAAAAAVRANSPHPATHARARHARAPAQALLVPGPKPGDPAPSGPSRAALGASPCAAVALRCPPRRHPGFASVHAVSVVAFEWESQRRAR